MLIKKTILSIRSRGLKETFLIIVYDLIFSIRYGAKFNESIKLNSLRINSPNRIHGVPYKASSYYYVKLAFRNLPVDFKKSFLIDFGSGKGNVILMAYNLGFQKILGIEFAQELASSSEEKIKKMIGKNSNAEITIINTDAVSYAIPPDSNVFFFYNPFNNSVFEKVLDNIEKSLNLSKRKIFIVYINAVISFDLFSRYGYSEIFKHSSREKTEILILNK